MCECRCLSEGLGSFCGLSPHGLPPHFEVRGSGDCDVCERTERVHPQSRLSHSFIFGTDSIRHCKLYQYSTFPESDVLSVAD